MDAEPSAFTLSRRFANRREHARRVASGLFWAAAGKIVSSLDDEIILAPPGPRSLQIVTTWSLALDGKRQRSLVFPYVRESHERDFDNNEHGSAPRCHLNTTHKAAKDRACLTSRRTKARCRTAASAVPAAVHAVYVVLVAALCCCSLLLTHPPSL